MKNRTSLVLMEQLVMIMVFALAAALCLRVFVTADEISRKTASRDGAVLIAQNAAEVLKATSGDTDRTAELLRPMAEAEGYRIELEKLESHMPLLGRAEIQVYLEDELLFSICTGWQEEES